MSNFDSFSYFQTSLSLGVEQGLQKLPKYDINDLRLLFHSYILIPRKCPSKTPSRFSDLPTGLLCKYLACLAASRFWNLENLVVIKAIKKCFSKFLWRQLLRNLFRFAIFRCTKNIFPRINTHFKMSTCLWFRVLAEFENKQTIYISTLFAEFDQR